MIDWSNAPDDATHVMMHRDNEFQSWYKLNESKKYASWYRNGKWLMSGWDNSRVKDLESLGFVWFDARPPKTNN